MKVRPFTVAAATAFVFTLAGCAAPASAPPPLVSGLDRASFDMAVRPQDDLFRHVNGGWLARTEVPADRPMHGTFVELRDRAEDDLHALVQGLVNQTNRPANSPAQQIADLYTSFLDEAALNRL